MISKENRALWGLSLGHFFLDMYASVLIPLYPLIATKLNISLAKISSIIAISYGISSLLQPLFGYISDKLQKRIFMFFGLIFASCFMPFGFVAGNSFVLTLCLIFGMAGNAFYHPQTTIMIKEFYSDKIALSKAMGIYLGLGTLGYSIGPYLSSCCVKYFDDDKFIYISVVGITLAFVMLFFVPNIKKKTNKDGEKFLNALIAIIKNKTCRFLTVVTIIKSALIMSYSTYISFLFKESGFSITLTGMIMTTFFIISGFSMIFASRLEKIYKLKGVIAISYIPLLPLVLLFLYALKHVQLIAIALFLLIGVFILLAAGCVLAAAQKELPKYSGTISGIIQGFTLAVGSLLLIPFGIIGQKFGVGCVLILISSVALICGVYALKSKILSNN